MNSQFLELLDQTEMTYALIRNRVDLPTVCEIDILTLCPNAFANEVKRFYKQNYPNTKVSISFGSSHKRHFHVHLHVDVIYPDQPTFRYDLYSEDALYTHNCLRRGSLNNWHISCKKLMIDDFSIFILDDIFLTKVLIGEYLGSFVQYPSKYKHWEYLVSKVQDENTLYHIMHSEIDINLIQKKQSQQWRRRALLGYTPRWLHFSRNLYLKWRELGIKAFTQKVLGKIFK